MLLESRHIQTFRLHHMTKACVSVFALSGSLGRFYNVCRVEQYFGVCHHSVRVVLAEQAILFSMCLSLGYLWQARLLPQS